MPRQSPDAIWAQHFRAQNAPPPPPPPEPPAYLSERAAQIWRDIVASRAPTYFDAPNRHLLAAFCVSAGVADIVNDELAAVDPTDAKQRRRWNTLQIMAARQSRLMLDLATKMRLLPSKADAERAMQEQRQPFGVVR
jgi:hypothetical protein